MEPTATPEVWSLGDYRTYIGLSARGPSLNAAAAPRFAIRRSTIPYSPAVPSLNPHSMLEVTLARQHQRRPALVHQVDGFLILQRPAGVDDRRHPRIEQQPRPVRERKERIRRRHRPPCPLPRLTNRQPGGRRAVHLSCARPQQHSAFADRNRVALHMFARQPREPQVVHLLLARLPRR